MRNRNKVILAASVAILAVAGVAIALSKSAQAPNTSEQTPTQPAQQNEQNDDPDSEISPALDIDSQEFTLTGSNLSCSTTAVNGQMTHVCTGTIYIVPVSLPDHDPALYKINEQTQLSRGGQAQDLEDLKKLAESRTNVRLKLASDSGDTIASISY